MNHIDDSTQNKKSTLLGKPDMLSWIKDGMVKLPDNSKLPYIMDLLIALQYYKEQGYGSSWKGKGEYRGIMSNIDRKYDRLDSLISKEIIHGNSLTTKTYEELSAEDKKEIGESKIDTVADLANYCLLYLCYLKDTYPGAFQVWAEKNIPASFLDNIENAHK